MASSMAQMTQPSTVMRGPIGQIGSPEGVFGKGPRAINPNTLIFRMNPTRVSYVNTLRRLILQGVETVMFRADMKSDGTTSDVEVHKNTTAMTHEMLAHRIGLIPIHVEDPLSWDPDRYRFILHEKNTTELPMNVKASHFKVQERDRDGGWMDAPEANTMFFRPDPISNDTCLITILKPKIHIGGEDEVHITAKASAGFGRQNARFVPSSQVSYKYTTHPQESAEVAEYFDKWLMNHKKVDPATVNKEPGMRDTYMREFMTMEIDRVYLKDESGEPYSFDFVVESAGVLNPYYIVQRAFEVGIDLCRRYGNTGQAGLPKNVYIQPATSRVKGFEFIFLEEDHTLGNLIQSYIDYNMMGAGSGVEYVGYKVPHPLRDEMVICIATEDGSDETAIRILKEAAQGCERMFLQWRKEWMRFMPKDAYPKPLPPPVFPNTENNASKNSYDEEENENGAVQASASIPVQTVLPPVNKKPIMSAAEAKAEAVRKARERAAAAAKMSTEGKTPA